jgi:peptidoglycan/LPS O-acetylase OafA/YrhL
MIIRPRLYLLDILRGLASLSVLVWHYQHFFAREGGVIRADFSATKQPFFDILHVFYVHGHEAVPVFFTLSGFVMFATYFDSIASRKTTAWTFVTLRFSRLYPLHFATLLIVATLQLLSHQFDGKSIIFDYNDWWHFGLQLLFASHWGLQSGYSFNGPIWSVSIEIGLYAAFFMSVFYLGNRVRNSLILVLALFCLATTLALIPPLRELSHPAACFFLGGVACIIWNAARTDEQRIILVCSAAVVAVAGFAAYALLLQKPGTLHFIAFPALIVLLAALQSWYPKLGCHTRTFGDITYATYLIHTPIQITVMLVAKYYGVDIDFYSPITFLLFIAVVSLVAIPTHRYFELPMQQLCRRILLGEAPKRKSLLIFPDSAVASRSRAASR